MSRILVAAYHPIVLKGISEFVSEKLPGSEIIASATHAKTFLSLLEIHKPDAAIVDVTITWKSEIDILDEIYRIHPTIKLHFISTHPFDKNVQKYLVKKTEQYVLSQSAKLAQEDTSEIANGQYKKIS